VDREAVSVGSGDLVLANFDWAHDCGVLDPDLCGVLEPPVRRRFRLGHDCGYRGADEP
jgi:hypothetical protein